MEPIFTNEEVFAAIRDFGIAVDSREKIIGVVVRDAVEAKFYKIALAEAEKRTQKSNEDIQAIGRLLSAAARRED